MMCHHGLTYQQVHEDDGHEDKEDDKDDESGLWHQNLSIIKCILKLELSQRHDKCL